MNPDEIEALGVQADGLLADHERLLGELIALRRDRRMTEQAVAERMGVSEQDVVEFERYDSNPTLDLVRRYALAMEEVPLKDLDGFTNNTYNDAQIGRAHV